MDHLLNDLYHDILIIMQISKKITTFNFSYSFWAIYIANKKRLMHAYRAKIKSWSCLHMKMGIYPLWPSQKHILTSLKCSYDVEFTIGNVQAMFTIYHGPLFCCETIHMYLRDYQVVKHHITHIGLQGTVGYGIRPIDPFLQGSWNTHSWIKVENSEPMYSSSFEVLVGEDGEETKQCTLDVLSPSLGGFCIFARSRTERCWRCIIPRLV